MFDALPEKWCEARLGDLVAIVTDGITANELAAIPEVHHYSLPAFDQWGQPEVGPGSTIKSNKTAVPADCVLFSKLNPRIPRIWRVNALGSAHSYCSTEFWPLVRINKRIDLDYLTYFLRSERFLRDPTITPSSSTNSHQRVDRRSFEAFVLPVPPLDEQRRIAEVLRSVDAGISVKSDVIQGALSVRQSLLHEYFHCADWEADREIPKGWKVRLLDEVAKRGSGHTPNKKIPRYWGGTIKWVSLQDTKRLDKVYIDQTAEMITAEGIANSSAVLHPPGVVVISRDATVGRSAITTEEMAVSQHFIAYKCESELDNFYLYYWLQRMKPVFERIGAGSTIKTIGLPFFKGLKIALPPLEEQIEISKLALEVDSLIFSEEKSLNQLKAIKLSLSADLLSGRVRVPV